MINIKVVDKEVELWLIMLKNFTFVGMYKSNGEQATSDFHFIDGLHFDIKEKIKLQPFFSLYLKPFPT